MKAIAYTEILPTTEIFLEDIVIERPTAPQGYDILVKIEAVSVNPVDTKVRMRDDPNGTPKILGYDASGTVEEIGSDVTFFKKGDRVFYAGAIHRSGTNAEYHLVDERIVGHMPNNLDFAEAAALPLTAITAWEALFDRLRIQKGQSGGAILILGGAGGVGSIAIQLARQLTGLKIIATASRPETQDWCREMGAHYVIDHSADMVKQVEEIGLSVKYIFSTNASDQHWDAIGEIIAPQGSLCLIDDPDIIDIRTLKHKAITISWELMFTRSLFETEDISEQHNLLNSVSKMIEKGSLKTTSNEIIGKINAENLRKAHIAIETGRTYGKIVLSQFD